MSVLGVMGARGVSYGKSGKGVDAPADLLEFGGEQEVGGVGEVAQVGALVGEDAGEALDEIVGGGLGDAGVGVTFGYDWFRRDGCGGEGHGGGEGEFHGCDG